MNTIAKLNIEKRVLHYLEILGIQALVALPALVESKAARDFVAHHAGLAVYFPLVVSGVGVAARGLAERLARLAGTTVPAAKS